MRVKDDKKQEALFLATVNVVNEIGFSASSVSKIAKEAGVSPATLYIYFQNKEDLIVSTYVEIKRDMSAEIMTEFDDNMPVRDVLEKIWFNTFSYISKNSQEFRFAEQFSNSPYTKLVDKEEVEGFFEPLINVINRGIEQKILKNVHMDILGVFILYPIFILSNPNRCECVEISEENKQAAFQMAWDAIRL